MGAITKWLLARILREGSARPDVWTTERIDAIWDQFDQGTQRAILRLTRSATLAELAAAGSAPATLGAPALVLWGEQDPWLTPGIGAIYAEVLSQATLEVIPDAGHWPWMDPAAGGRSRSELPGGAGLSTSSRKRPAAPPAAAANVRPGHQSPAVA